MSSDLKHGWSLCILHTILGSILPESCGVLSYHKKQGNAVCPALSVFISSPRAPPAGKQHQCQLLFCLYSRPQLTAWGILFVIGSSIVHQVKVPGVDSNATVSCLPGACVLDSQVSLFSSQQTQHLPGGTLLHVAGHC